MTTPRTFFIIILMVYCWIGLRAQGIRFSIKADPQVSWVSPGNKNLDGSGSHIGLSGGLVFDRFFAENYAITTGLFVHSTGGSITFRKPLGFGREGNDTIYGPDTEMKLKLQYLQIPLGLKLKTRQFGYITWFGQLGLFGEVNLKAVADIRHGEYGVSVAEEIRAFNAGYFIGGGLEYSLGGNTALTTGLNYSHGFTNAGSSSGVDINLRSIALRLGVVF